MQALSPKQQRFVEEYLVDLNATQAAIRAGYSPRSAQMQSSRLLSNAMVAKAIQAGRAAMSERAEISATRVLEEYAKIAFANMGDYLNSAGDGRPFIDLSDLSRDQTAVLSEVTFDTINRGEDLPAIERTKFKLHDKLKALDSLAKHLGLFEKDNEQKNPGDALASLIAAINGKGSKAPIVETETEGDV